MIRFPLDESELVICCRENRVLQLLFQGQPWFLDLTLEKRRKEVAETISMCLTQERSYLGQNLHARSYYVQ